MRGQDLQISKTSSSTLMISLHRALLMHLKAVAYTSLHLKIAQIWESGPPYTRIYLKLGVTFKRTNIIKGLIMMMLVIQQGIEHLELQIYPFKEWMTLTYQKKWRQEGICKKMISMAKEHLRMTVRWPRANKINLIYIVIRSAIKSDERNRNKWRF